jgi:hypothetical protein
LQQFSNAPVGNIGSSAFFDVSPFSNYFSSYSGFGPFGPPTSLPASLSATGGASFSNPFLPNAFYPNPGAFNLFQ